MYMFRNVILPWFFFTVYTNINLYSTVFHYSSACPLSYDVIERTTKKHIISADTFQEVMLWVELVDVFWLPSTNHPSNAFQAVTLRKGQSRTSLKYLNLLFTNCNVESWTNPIGSPATSIHNSSSSACLYNCYSFSSERTDERSLLAGCASYRAVSLQYPYHVPFLTLTINITKLASQSSTVFIFIQLDSVLLWLLRSWPECIS